MIRAMCTTVILLAVIAATIASSRAADVARGAQLARQWCANCHVMDGAGTATVQQGPPSFRSIGLTAEQLRTFLTHPHGAMPDFALTRTEIDDVIAYIETLR
jgi:mono/diheme cytochrome c family protein